MTNTITFKLVALMVICIFFMCKGPSDLLQVNHQHLQYIFLLLRLYLLPETLCSCKYKRLPTPYNSLQIY